MKSWIPGLLIGLAILTGNDRINATTPPLFLSFRDESPTNGLLIWTNAPGTNAFVLEWAPSLTNSWTYATPPLDLSISTNTRATDSAPIIPPIGFYRLLQGFGPQVFHGAWILTTGKQFYIMSNGNGVITNIAVYNVATPAGSYSVTNNNGGVLFTINTTGGSGSISFPGQFDPPNDIKISVSGTSGTLAPVENLSLCAGNWSGTLTETNDPNGLNDYSIDLDVNTNGFATVSGDLFGTGWMFALGPTNGVFSSFFHTTSTGNYDQFEIIGTLTGNTITGSFNTDSGSGANAIDGTVTLTR